MNILKKKPYLVRTVGEYIFKFYYKENSLIDTYLEINTSSNVFSMKLLGTTYSYGYLLEAAHQGLDEQLSGFATYNYLVATQITQDQQLVNDLTQIINKWYKRKEDAAKKAAKAVSDAQNMGDEALLREAIKRGKMNRKEAKKASQADRKEMQNIINEE